jgi:hypothetical protein
MLTTTTIRLYRPSAVCLLLTLLTALALSDALAQNQPGTTQAPAAQRPALNTPAQNQRRPAQTSGNVRSAAPATQPQANLSRWQSLRNRIGQGGESFKHLITKPFSHNPAPQPPSAAGHPLPAPSTTTPHSRGPRVSEIDSRDVPGSGRGREDNPPLFSSHAPPATSRLVQPLSGSVQRKTADGSNMYVRHGADGTRQVLVERPDGSRVFAAAPGASYVQRPWNYQAQAFDRRTYTNGAQVTQQFYRQYSYNGTTLDAYAPQRYYDPSVYQWALRSRTPPVPASWNYVTNPTPWYNQYRSYFTPESSYTNALEWLTDYLIANSLIASWNAHLKSAPAVATGAPSPAAAGPSSAPAQAAPAAASPDSTAAAEPEVTTDVKRKVAEEIGRQVREESTEAQANAKNKDIPAGKGGIVAELNEPDLHTFVVSSDLNLTDEDGRRCALTEGDVLQVIAPPDPKDNTAKATVLSSKHGECGRAADVAVGVTDLQEMQNHMRETIDQGLANRAGKSGIEATPASFAAAAPPPEPDAGQQVEQQQKIAAAEG